ncbi:MAG: VOC family protein [Candidatus Omnitrophica bacterium]|nr:VOC family protein [Candidatus Omnitrophota bacterium]
MGIKFKKFTPDLMVSDVATTVKFYTKKLGFKLDMLVPENEKTMETNLIDDKEYIYAMLSRDEVFVMFMRKDVYAADIPALSGVPIGASAAFYCGVENVGELYHSYEENGVPIIKDIATTWYGMKEFYIRDCHGYILGFAEPAPRP